MTARPERRFPLLKLRGREYLRDFGYGGVGGLVGTALAVPFMKRFAGAGGIARQAGLLGGTVIGRGASAKDAEQVRKELGLRGKKINLWRSVLVRGSTRLATRRFVQNRRSAALK